MSNPDPTDHRDDQGAGHGHESTSVFIDGKPYETRERNLSGAQIRQLATPPISQDRDLWLEAREGLDKLIGDTQEVHLVDGLRFFTVPKVINPGCS